MCMQVMIAGRSADRMGRAAEIIKARARAAGLDKPIVEVTFTLTLTLTLGDGA